MCLIYQRDSLDRQSVFALELNPRGSWTCPEQLCTLVMQAGVWMCALGFTARMFKGQRWHLGCPEFTQGMARIQFVHGQGSSCGRLGFKRWECLSVGWSSSGPCVGNEVYKLLSSYVKWNTWLSWAFLAGQGVCADLFETPSTKQCQYVKRFSSHSRCVF